MAFSVSVWVAMHKGQPRRLGEVCQRWLNGSAQQVNVGQFLVSTNNAGMLPSCDGTSLEWVRGTLSIGDPTEPEPTTQLSVNLDDLAQEGRRRHEILDIVVTRQSLAARLNVPAGYTLIDADELIRFRLVRTTTELAQEHEPSRVIELVDESEVPF